MLAPLADKAKTALVRWMPWVTRSAHRHIQVFLAERGYRERRVLSWGRAYVVEKDGTRHVFKRTGENGLVFHVDILPAIDRDFTRLVVPTLLDAGRHAVFGPWLMLDWIEGEGCADCWDERDPPRAGGRAVPDDLIDPVAEVVADLASIPPSVHADSKLEQRNTSFVLGRAEPQWTRARDLGLLESAEERALRKILQPLLDTVETGPLGLSNHDFYFRNLVRCEDGKLGLIDWDVARMSSYESEHCVTYLWMTMWNNRDWADAFFRAAAARIPLDWSLVRGAMVLNGLNQSMLVWRDKPDLRVFPWKMLLRVLDDRWFDAFRASIESTPETFPQ